MNTFSKAVFLGLTIGLLNPALADDQSQTGGYKNSSGDFPRHVTATKNPRPPVVAEDTHHNDGGQDRSGQNWSKAVISADQPPPVEASSNRSLREWGWNSK